MSNSNNRRRIEAFLLDRYVCLSAVCIILKGFFITAGKIKKEHA